MKNIIFPFILLCTVTTGIIYSCKKSNNDAGLNTQSLSQVFAGLRSTPQNITINAGRDTTVLGADSTVLHFYTNSFKDANGNVIKSGIVSLQLIEMYKAGDMICNGTTTMTKDSLLVSGGEVNIIATMNGKKVYANKYGIGFKQPTASSQSMQLFYGQQTNTDSITTWIQSDPTEGTIAYRTDTNKFGIGNIFQFDSVGFFGFMNCDLYEHGTALTSVSVIFPDNSFNPNNTAVFIVLKIKFGTEIHNSVMANSKSGYDGTPLGYDSTTNTLMIVSEGEKNIVPAGTNYELVAITNKNGSYYYYEQAGVIPSGGLTAKAVMGAETQGDIKARLRGL